jgi:hypothetical protein
MKQADGSIVKRKVAPLYRSVEDPVTGLRWEWKEVDYPGLFAFLTAFVRKWSGPVVIGTSTLKGGSIGGAKGARTRQALASDWQRRSEREVRRLLNAGMTDSNIGVLLAEKLGRRPRTIARYAAELRKKSAK